MSIFLIPWKNIEDSLEFRVFVYITICVQKWLNTYHYTDKITDDLEKALTHFQNNFVNQFEHMNYSADLYLIEDLKQMQLIEVNPWGNSGPGLFTYDELNMYINTEFTYWKILEPKVKKRVDGDLEN